ncbi:hypothetical protein EIN_085590 [Entamoeba invadens IP1]|uniref:hypothetical protein n=1 Tax=Entamoeba invadens IP1 TaxID=370355 RepID=UPI0002C3F4EA|nr:hypothetical protein EIN_085590 [Entamoeba invadens IP1]ELP85317.1 hypothetical protein EIN_085590 [Entamoeba invadens IP1]|eukprot:XP_004184663.1 hypothetical protein EIN_085590 [Entamoeba invadens IP1]
MTALFISSLFLLAVYSSQVTYTTCSNNQKLVVNSIEAIPWPPESGVTIIITMNITTSEKVETLMLENVLESKYGMFWVELSTTKNNLCDTTIDCPILGNKTFKMAMEIPPMTPTNSQWRATLSFKREENKIGCVRLDPFVVS